MSETLSFKDLYNKKYNPNYVEPEKASTSLSFKDLYNKKYNPNYVEPKPETKKITTIPVDEVFKQKNIYSQSPLPYKKVIKEEPIDKSNMVKSSTPSMVLPQINFSTTEKTQPKIDPALLTKRKIGFEGTTKQTISQYTPEKTKDNFWEKIDGSVPSLISTVFSSTPLGAISKISDTSKQIKSAWKTYSKAKTEEPLSFKERLIENQKALENYQRYQRKEENISKVTTPIEEYTAPTTFIGKLEDLYKYKNYGANVWSGFLKPAIGTTAEQIGVTTGLSDIRKWGEDFGDKMFEEEKRKASSQSMADVPSFFEGGYKDPRYFAKTISQAIGFFSTILGVSTAVTAVSGNPVAGTVAGMSTGAALESSGAYKSMLDSGVNPNDANTAAAIYGVIATIIENATGLKPAGGTKTLIKDFSIETAKDSGVKKFFKTWLEEGVLEEGSQQLMENVVTKFVNKNQKLFENVAESMVGGLIGSAPLVGGGAVISKNKESIKDYIKNPKIGLGIEEVSNKPAKVNDITKAIPEESLIKEANWKQAQETGEKVIPKTKIQKQIESVTKTKPAEFVTIKKKETTLLKERLKNIARISKLESKKEQITSRLKLETKEKINKIKRQEQLNKLKQRIKDRENFIKRGERAESVRQKQETREVQKEIREAIKNSELEAKDREKFSDMLKNIQTREQLQRKMPEIEERIKNLEEKEERRSLKNEIRNELKNIKVKKINGKPVGKFTAEVQKTLDLLSKTVNLTKEQAEEKIEENIKNSAGTPSLDIVLQNKILSMIAKGSDVNNLQKILSDIQEIKNTGEITRELRKFNLQSEYESLQNLVINQVTTGKGVDVSSKIYGEQKNKNKEFKQSLKTLGKKWIVSWGGLMDIIDFNTSVENKKLSEQFNLLKEENKTKQLQYEFNENIKEIVSDVYGIKNDEIKIHKKIGELTEKNNLGEFKNINNENIELILSKDEAIKVWMELQDPTLFDSFIEGNGYTEEIILAIDSFLTEKDKQFAEEQFKLYKEQWKKINPIYSEIYGVELPFNEFYSPIKRVGFKTDELSGLGEFVIDTINRKALSSTSFKTRTKNLLPIEIQSSISALERHITETNYFIAWATKVRELRSVFGNEQVKQAIEQEFGKSIMSSINNSIDDFTTAGNRVSKRYKALDYFRSKATLGALMLKPAIGVKQLVSTLAYLEKTNPIEFTNGIIDFWKNPIKNTKILNNESILIKTRSTNFERDIKEAMKSDTYKRFSKKQNFINTAMLSVRLGDKGAILMGSWAMRKASLKKGMSLDETIKAYENFSAETQQSSDLSRLSELQRGGSFEQLFTMFKSSQRQYLAKELQAVKSLFQKDGLTPTNIKKVAKTLAIYHFLLPVVFQYIANLGGWDEEDKKEYMRAGILGSINGLFIVGDVLDSILRQIIGLKVWNIEVPIVSVVNDINKAIRELDFDDITSEDVFNALKEITSVGNALGLPVDQVKNINDGVVDIKNKDIKIGIAELLGWSSYVLGGNKTKTKIEKTFDKLMSLPKEERLKEYKNLEQKDKTQINYLLLERKYNLPKELTNLRGETVEKRAKEIIKYFKKLESSEKSDMIKKLKNVGILTDTVSKKIIELKQK